MNKQAFVKPHRIRFSECDPAGIVFYPQYFVMFNDLLEAWVDELLPDGGFAAYIQKHQFGLPTVRLEADFRAVSRMGDAVTLELEVDQLGGKSITLALRCVGAEGDLRMSVRQVLVTTSLVTHKAIAIPDILRRALNPENESEKRSES